MSQANVHVSPVQVSSTGFFDGYVVSKDFARRVFATALVVHIVTFLLYSSVFVEPRRRSVPFLVVCTLPTKQQC